MKYFAVIIGCLVLVFGLSYLFLGKPAVAPSSPSETPSKNKEVVSYVNASADLIKVSLPFPGVVVGKKFSVMGTARGGWFFEASFPIVVLDKNGNVLFQTPAKAEGDWMTENFVPFRADIIIPASYIGSAKIILKKDNPSGMPEHDASASFNVVIEY